MILVLGKARSHRAPNLGFRRAESPGWVDVSPKTLQEMRCTSRCIVMMWRSCQSPVAHSCSLLNHPNSFHRGMFKLNTKIDADLLLYLLSHLECHGHTVHMLTEQRLPPPLTSAVKLSLFTCAHSSPLSLAARLHRCRTNLSHYIDNGWTFSGQTWYTFVFTLRNTSKNQSQSFSEHTERWVHSGWPVEALRCEEGNFCISNSSRIWSRIVNTPRPSGQDESIGKYLYAQL